MARKGRAGRAPGPDVGHLLGLELADVARVVVMIEDALVVEARLGDGLGGALGEDRGAQGPEGALGKDTGRIEGEGELHDGGRGGIRGNERREGPRRKNSKGG